MVQSCKSLSSQPRHVPNIFQDNDKSLFISRVVPGSPADRAGLSVGDKLIEVNGTSMVNQRHDTAVECMQLNADAVELVIRRQPLKAVSREPTPAVNQSKQVCATTTTA